MSSDVEMERDQLNIALERRTALLERIMARQEKAVRERDEARARVVMLEIVLRFYADPENWDQRRDARGHMYESFAEADRGMRARRALGPATRPSDTPDAGDPDDRPPPGGGE